VGPIDYERARQVTETLEQRLVSAIRNDPVSRRTVLGGMALAAGAGTAGVAGASGGSGHTHAREHGNFGAVGEYSGDRFDPYEFLRDFDTGEIVGTDDDGRPIREFQLDAVDVPMEVAPGIQFATWAFNGQVPGPTLRAIEGELIRVRFQNGSDHAHTIHPHVKNLNPAMDGIPQNGPGVLDTGESFTYEWIAQPAGFHFYHCHSLPLKEHIHRGLYGGLLVDPDPDRVHARPEEYAPYHASQITTQLRDEMVAEAETRNHEYAANDGVDELVIVMNGFDTNFDGDNEIYAANSRAFAYGVGRTDGKGNWAPGETKYPIQIDRNQRVRVYLLNTTEFDLINSFHTHSQFFDYYDHGTTLVPTHDTIDTIMQCQAQRGIVELDYSDHQPGLYMFHAHQSEFAELGWMSFFEVV